VNIEIRNFDTTGTLAHKELLIFGALMIKMVNNENGEASGRWQMLVGILISW
jgi:hypothetical protein